MLITSSGRKRTDINNKSCSKFDVFNRPKVKSYELNYLWNGVISIHDRITKARKFIPYDVE